MSIQLNFSGTIVEIPSTGQSPQWANGIIEAFQAIEASLQGFSGPFDVPPQIQSIDSYNPGSNVDLQSAVFPTSDVQSVELIYSVFRETTTNSVSETGTLKAVYNPNNSPGSQWEFSRFGNGEAYIDFTFLDTGQVQFSTTAIAGSNHTGRISFLAKALLQTS